jgi:ERCC4-type nuclease
MCSTSMLLIDSRIGSADLAEPLAAMGLPVELTQLEFADVCFAGRGDNDTPVMVGIELKKLGDLVSSLRTGRLSGHQLPGLVGPDSIYEYAWLLVEGTYRPGTHGIIEVPSRFGSWRPLQGKMPLSELEKRVLTLELLGGLHVRFTAGRPATLHFLANLYHWFTDQSMDRHSSHIAAIHKPSTILRISDLRKTFATLPGVGVRTSLFVEQRFGNIESAFLATQEEWEEIEGIGPKTANAIMRYIHGEG